jgi:hypothetical protein
MKNQIEHSQHLIERTQVKLQKDFENWWNEQCAILVCLTIFEFFYEYLKFFVHLKEEKQQKGHNSFNKSSQLSTSTQQNYFLGNNFSSNNSSASNTANNSLYSSRNSSGASLLQVC